MTSPNVLVVGLDAACFERLDPLMDAGVVPNIAELLDGTAAPMETTMPPWTPSAWPSVVTGARPWTHGVYDFYHYEEDPPRHVSARDVRVPYVWEVLAAHGHQSIVVNVPVTHPPHRFEGSLVPGYIAPESTDCLVDSEPVPLAEFDDDYRIYPRSTDTDAERVAEYRDLATSRADVAESLADEHPWSFMMVQFQVTDSVFHSLGHDDDAIEHVFEAVDDAVGRLRELAGDDAAVFVVSDHGMHRYDGIFHGNAWLRDRDYLETTTASSRNDWNERTQNQLAGGGDDDATGDGEDAADTDESGRAGSVAGSLVRGLQRVGITPQRVERTLDRLGLTDVVLERVPESVLMDVVDAGEHVDWTTSRAYVRSCASLGVRCNVDGRDPDGVVPQSEFEDLRRTLVEELQDVRTPDGDRLFDDVYDRHRRHGADVANERSAPDVVLEPREMAWEVSDVVRENAFTATDEFNHSRYGLFAATGPGVEETATVEPSVVDVVPTVLSLFGIEPLEEMDGHVLESVLSEEATGGSVTRATAGEDSATVGDREFFEDDDDDLSGTVEDQLRDMGYIQ